MQLAPRWYTFIIALFVSFGSFLFGYDLGIIASILPSTDFARVMGPRYEDLNLRGLITSLLTLGAFFGQPTSGYLADKFGRRLAIIFGCVVFLLGGALQTAAQNINMMLAGRFFAGWGIGNLAMLAPLYQSEIAQPAIRGRLTSLQQFMLGLGAFVASWVGYGCYTYHGDEPLGWRLPLAIQMVPALPLAFCILLCPESPRWLALVGRDAEAKETLAVLHAHGNTNDPLVEFEYQDILASIKRESSTENPLKELFTKAYYFRPLLLGIILQFSVQMTGVSALQYYSSDIFAAAGFTAERALYFQAYSSLLALAAELTCIFTIDKVGRRWPLIICNLLSGATFAIESAIIVIYPASSTNTHAHLAFIMMTWFYNIVFSYGIGPLSWVYPVEVLPNHLRSTGTSITTMASWISNFMIGQITPKAFAAIGWRYYLVFCILSTTNAITFWALLPETKGRRLEEMHDYFKTSGWFVPTNPAPRVSAAEMEDKMRHGELEPGHMKERGDLAYTASEGMDKGQAEQMDEQMKR